MQNPLSSTLAFLLLGLQLWSNDGFVSAAALAVDAPAQSPWAGLAGLDLQHGTQASPPWQSRFKRSPVPALEPFVFRGLRKDMPPSVVKQKGGLFPHNDNPASLTADAYRVVYHQKDEKNASGKNSAYASTSTALEVAAYFAGKGGYIYVIKTTPNMFPVAQTVDGTSLAWEREYVALGGVRFEQIVGCFHVPLDTTLDIPEKPDWNQRSNDGFPQSMEMLQGLVKSGALVPEKGEMSYDRKYDTMSASPGQPQLAGYLPWDEALENERYKGVDPEKSTWMYAKEFMDSIGASQGWSDRFPLFRNPKHMAAIKAQDEEAAAGKDKAVAESATDPGVSTGDVLYAISPVKPFVDLVEAIRSDQKLSVGEWLGILGGVGLEILALAPTPAAVGIRALKIARAGYRVSKAIKTGARAAGGVARGSRAKTATDKANQVSTELDVKLEKMEVRVPMTPSAPPMPGSINHAVGKAVHEFAPSAPPLPGTVKQPMGKIARIADKVKVDNAKPAGPGTSALSPTAVDRMLKQLEKLEVPNDPVVPVMRHVVKEAAKKIKMPEPALTKRRKASAGLSLADALEVFAAAKEGGKQVPLGALEDILDKVEEGMELATYSFLKEDKLWLGLETMLL